MIAPTLMGAARLRQLLADHDFVPRKRWGQNFVVDPNTIRKVIKVAGLAPTDRVIEVGAGAGSLTLGLAAAAGSVVAVEADSRLEPVLRESLGSLANVEIVLADVLSLQPADFKADRMVGNLPYNLAATIVLHMLAIAQEISDLTVMTQREVGERLAAPPGSEAYGQTSVLVAYWGDARVAAQVSRSAFWPVPNVDSVLVRITRRSPPEVDRDRLYEVVKAAFSQRRKTLRNSLAAVAGSGPRAEDVLKEAGLDPGARAEELDLDAFAAIARILS